MRYRLCLAVCFVLSSGITGLAQAIELFFEPDTTVADSGQIVEFSCLIGPSDLLRGFTVYMAYDTNMIDLYEPPVPGALVANQQGLQFNYFDHAPFQPNRLEIGATIFSEDFWQGPGEIFRMRMILRTCGVESIDAPFRRLLSPPTIRIRRSITTACWYSSAGFRRRPRPS